MSQSQIQTALLTIRLFSEKHPSFSQAALRNIRFHQDTNGFAPAFVCVGRRVLIDEDAFFQVIRQQNARAA